MSGGTSPYRIIRFNCRPGSARFEREADPAEPRLHSHCVIDVGDLGTRELDEAWRDVWIELSPG